MSRSGRRELERELAAGFVTGQTRIDGCSSSVRNEWTWGYCPAAPLPTDPAQGARDLQMVEGLIGHDRSTRVLRSWLEDDVD
jgi:hypothetical protein